MRTRIENATIILSHRLLKDGWLTFEDGVILDFGEMRQPERVPAEQTIDAQGRYLSPGFVDLHVHGGGGCDFRDRSEADFLTAMRTHLKGGTTTMLATLSSTTTEATLENIHIYNRLKQKETELSGIPRMAGIHLEGPYFSYAQRGAQDERLIRNPDPQEYGQILNATPYIKRWSIACELPGALELGRKLHKMGIMASVGHSDASTAQVMQAFDNGFTSVTHLYSGCSLVHRNGPFREGGVVEAAFLLDEMDVEVIADGVHLPRELLKLIYKIKGADRIALITDSIRAGGMAAEDGTKVYDDKAKEREIFIESGVAIMPDRLNFAGSIATTSRLVRTMTQIAEVDLPSAVRMAALTPARMLGLDAFIGSIAPGKRADLLLFDENIKLYQVIVDGTILVD